MRCSFCKKQIKSGTGKMFARDDGRIYYFDKQKCERNIFNLGRKSAKLKWTRQR